MGDSARATLLDLQHSWPFSDEFKAILGELENVRFQVVMFKLMTLYVQGIPSVRVLLCEFPGGVLGFWGGVGSMGCVFLMVLLAQRYCCTKRLDKEGAG